jgi:Ribbon-helix-helix protein, copG family
MEPEVDDLSVRKPVGAVLSVRVPGEVAAAVDEYAAAHGLTLSEVVRVALDRLLAGGGTAEAGGLQGSSTAPYMTVTVHAAPTGQRTTSVAETRALYGSEVDAG